MYIMIIMHWGLLQCSHKNLVGYLAFIKTSEFFFVIHVISFEKIAGFSHGYFAGF